MFRNLVAKVLKSLLSKVEVKKEVVSVEDYCTITSSKSVPVGIKVHDRHEEKLNSIEKLPINSEEKRIYINDCLESIGAELYVKGYKELRTILEQYHVEVVQAYVLSQLVQLGQYSPEEDNLDSRTKEQLYDMALENNQLLFRQRQIEQGKAQVSEKQLKMISDLSKQLKVQPVMPKDKFEASEIIEALNKRLGNKPSDGKPSEKQMNAINNMCKKLGKELALSELAVDIKSASSLIADLQKELESHPELNTPNLASPSQVDYVKRLLATQKKRWTAKREESYKSMTSKEISEVISTLKAECEADGLISNLATEGQVKYILSLGKLLKKNYNPTEVKALTKDAATKYIDKLQRAYLHFLYKGNGSHITIEEINKMTIAGVRQLIEQLELERKTNLYSKGADDYSSAQQCL